MNDQNENSLFDYFKKQIAKEATNDFQLEEEKISKLIKEKKDSIQQTLQAKYDLKRQLMKTELKYQHDQDIRQLETKFLKQNSLQRVETIDKLFHAVEAKIKMMTTSNTYDSFIKEWLLAFPTIDLHRPVTVFIGKEDQRIQVILQKYLSKANFQIDSGIRLGGFYLQFDQESIRYDFTLDAKWAQTKAMFFEEMDSHE